MTTVLAAVDTTDTLDTAFEAATNQYACPVCKEPRVFHIFRYCPWLAALMREGTACAKGKMHPRWDLDVQDIVYSNKLLKQSSSGKPAANN